jgi:hypothetical protein
LHCIIFNVVLLGFIVIFFGASFKAGKMFIYDDGDTFNCTNATAIID